jgi:RNA recognition motif-containing protein
MTAAREEEALDQMKTDEQNLSAFQLKERKERTLFVGNLALQLTQKQLKKHFKQHLGSGSVEKVWLRSICVQQDNKMPERAKIITAHYNDQIKDSKNGYILLTSKDHIEKALELN